MAASSALPPPNANPSTPRIRRWVLTWALVVGIIAGVGALGYIVLFGWSISDAIYMTVITLTTEGYKEVRELSDSGRAWTMLVAVAGVGIIFGTVGFVAETFVAEALSGRRERRRMADRVAALKDHIILCGYGRVGSTVARELAHGGVAVVVIDSYAPSTDLAARDGHLADIGAARHEPLSAEAKTDADPFVRRLRRTLARGDGGAGSALELQEQLERLLSERLQVQSFDPRSSTSCAFATSTASVTGLTR